MADYTLTVYQANDTTPLFEVGTAATHAYPYLHVPEEFGEAEIDLENGKALIGQVNVRVIDPQTGAIQADRFLSGLLADVSGFSTINGRRALFQQVSPSAVIILDGVGYGVTLSDSFAGFSLQVRDIRERGRKVSVFTRTGTATVLPRGVLNGYGQLPNGAGLTPPTKPLTGTFTSDGGSSNSGVVKLDGSWEVPERVITEAVRKAATPAWSTARNRLTAPNLVIQWRPLAGGEWTYLRDMPVRDFYRMDGPLWYKNGTVKDAEGNKQAVRAVNWIDLFSTGTGSLPAHGQKVQIIVGYAGPASEEYPFHFEGTWGTFVRNLLRGDYCGLDEAGAIVNPRIRYDEALLTAPTGPFAVPIRVRLTEPSDDLRSVLEELCKALGAAPALNAAGEIAPIRYALPEASVVLPEINDGNAQLIPGWSHPADNAVTVVEVTYPRDFLVTATEDPTGERSAGDSIGTREVVIRRAPAELVAALGEQELKIDAWMFRALGGTEGQPNSGDVTDETGHQIAAERQHQALDRFGLGGVTSFVKLRAADFPTLKAGDWVLDARSWRPNYQTGDRGGNALAQVVSLRKSNPAWYEARLIDAGPADMPLGQPTLGAVTVSADGVVSVPVTALPAGGEARVDYAISTTLPVVTSPLWTFLGRTAAAQTLTSPALPAGLTVWTHARGEQVGRRPSAWTNAVSIATPATPRILRAGVTVAPDGSAAANWDKNGLTLGVRVYYSLHLAGIEPTFTSYIDAAASAAAVVLPVSVRPGETLSVAVEPWTGWTGAVVSGTAGARVVASDSLAADDSTFGLPGFRYVQLDADTTRFSWDSWGALVSEVRVFLGTYPRTSSEWPATTGAPTALLLDRAVNLYYDVDHPPPGYITRGYVVPIMEDGAPGEVYPITVQPTADAPDIITALSVLVNDDDGSVAIRVETTARTASVRIASTVDTTPAWPTTAAVEAGTVVAVVDGIAQLALAAGTVGYTEMVRVRAAPYRLANGLGTDGASDHGELRAAEDIRLSPPVTLEPTLVTEAGALGTYGVTVRDAAALATGLYTRTKAGEADWSAWALVTATPVSGTQYSQTVTLLEKHQSAVEFRLTYTLHGAAGHVLSVSPNLDRGAIPDGGVVAYLDRRTATASAYAIGDSDTTSWKIAASTSGYPSEATVRAQAAIPGRTLTPAQVGNLLAGLVAGQTVYLAAFAYGPNGDESSALIKAQAQFDVVAPVLEVSTETESATTGTFGVTVRDPAAVATGLYYRTKSGNAAWGAWTLKTGTVADNTAYSETVALVEDHLSHIEFRIDFTLLGDAQSLHQKSSGFDVGQIPNVAITPYIDVHARTASAYVSGDFDTASVKVAASTAGYPSEATVRAATAVNGRYITPALIGALVSSLTPGQVVYLSALGYSQAGGAGVESSALAQAQAPVGLVAPVLEVSTESESATTGTFGVTVRDPSAVATGLWYRTKSGSGAWGAWTLKTATPANATAYSEIVTLMEDHLSFVEFRLDYAILGNARSLHQKSSGFDKGKIPDTAVSLRVDASGNVTADLQGDYDTGSHRVAVSITGYPNEVTTRAAGAIAGRSASSGTLVSLNVGATAYVSVFGYSDAAGGGTEATALQRASITRMAFVAPKVTEDLTRSGANDVLTLTISDPLLKVTNVEFNKREGGTFSGWVTTWDSSTGTAGTDATLTRGEATAVALDAEIRYRVTFTDENGATKTVGSSIVLFAFIAPKVTEELSRSGTTGTLALTISDPLLRVTAVEWKESVQGAAYAGFSSAWSSSTGTSGVDATLTRSVARTLADGKDVAITYRVTFIDENGASKAVSNTVTMSNLSGLTKTIRIPFAVFLPESNAVVYAANSWYVALGANGTKKFYASVVLPFGVTITKFTTRTYRLAGDGTVARLVRGDGAGTTLATVNPASGTATTASGTLSENVTAGSTAIYTVEFELTKAVAGIDTPAIYHADIEYATPDYSKAI